MNYTRRNFDVKLSEIAGVVTGRPIVPTEAARNRKFGALIRRLRERKGISLREAARRLHVSPGLMSRAEHGKLDVRKHKYVDRLAAVLDADVNELRKAAGLESLDLAEVWLRIANEGADLVAVRLKNQDQQRLARVVGLVLTGIAFTVAVAREEGEEAAGARAALEETLRLLLFVVGRRPGAWYEGTPAKDEATKALHDATDAVLAALYRVHEKEFAEFLKP